MKYLEAKNKKLVRSICTTLCILIGSALMGCQTPAAKAQVQAKAQAKTNKTMSLGPGGKLTGEDLRISIQWIKGPSANHGPGDYA